ncbi:hypothetical protein ACE01N_17760 [Saccharicrinis sp. FJH2]|uniref:hypothetical protein n=1 Tax=Saccharicrinis sp. FJH65 TaxID=3344659 RepID=UPI0035F3A72A
MDIIISGAVANFPNISNEELLDKMKKYLPDCQIYSLSPSPGMVYSAAFDWKIIGKVSSILGIASFLWMIYSETIRSEKEKDSDAGIVITIENLNVNNNFWIGNDIHSEEELKQKLINTISADTIDFEKTKQIIDTIKISQNWKQK